MRAELVGLSFAVQPDKAFYIPCGHFYLGAPRQLDRGDVLQQLKPLLEDPARPKVGQNIKYDWIVLARHGVALDGVVFDTMLASYLLDPSTRPRPGPIALDFSTTRASLRRGGRQRKNQPTFAQVPLEEAVPYACEDADVTRWPTRCSRSAGRNRPDQLMHTVEMPLIPVLAAWRCGKSAGRRTAAQLPKISSTS